MFIAASLMLSFCIIFLQTGFTYYLSYQTLGMLLLIAIAMKGRPVLVNSSLVFVAMVAFTVFLVLTGFRVPVAISENSDNLPLTTIGVVGYAALILAASNLLFLSPRVVLRLLRYASGVTILISAGLLAAVDLGLFSSLTRESLILQNASLITNYISMDDAADSFAYLRASDLKPNIDLFYGEHSFLATVLFACVTCRLICEKVMTDPSLRPPLPVARRRGRGVISFVQRHSQALIVTLGAGSMIYIESFSSFFYVLVVCLSIMLSTRHRFFRAKMNLTRLLIMGVAVFILVEVALFVFEYYANRVSTISESTSFDQRFSSFFDFGLQDHLLGMADVSKMPRAGFHNSITYVIAIAGVGGIGFLIFVVYRVYVLARPLNLALLAVACVLGIFTQNGGVFSPNKVVILSLVLLPLACADRTRRVRSMSRPASYSHA